MTAKFEKLIAAMEGYPRKDYEDLPTAQKEEYATRRKEFVDWAQRILSREAGIKEGRQGGVRIGNGVAAELVKRTKARRPGAR